MTATRVGQRRRAPVPASRRHAVVGAAAAAVLIRALATTVGNTPVGPGGVSAALFGLSTAVTALGAVGLEMTTEDPTAGVGLLFVGVFGILSLVTGAVTLPAAVAVGAGTAAVALAVRRSLTPASVAAVGVLLIALTAGLVSGVGGWASLRPAASALALVGVAVTPVFAATTGRALIAGGLTFGTVVAVGLVNPFVMGTVTLVGGGVVGTSLPVVAFAAGGAVTAASAAGRRGEWLLFGGVALLALAGVPATLGRAIPFALGVATVTLWEGDR